MALIPNLFDQYDLPDDAAAGEVGCKYCGAFPLEWTEARTHPGNRKARGAWLMSGATFTRAP